MVPLRELKAKSAIHVERKGGGIQAADPQNSTMKRNVQKMSEDMKREITKIEGTFKPFERHVYTVLQNSIIGPTASLYQHLDHRYSLRKSQALVDHDYCEESFCQERVDCNETKMDLVANSIQRALTSKCVVKSSEQKVREQTSDSGTRDNKVLYEAVSQENNQVIASIEAQLQERRSLLTVNISNLKAPCPCRPNSHKIYVNSK